MKRVLTVSLQVMLITMLSSCYCFMKQVNSDTRDLKTKTNSINCCLIPGGGSHPIIVYYGFPNTDLKPLKNDSLDLKTFGLIGCRVEKYVAPIKSIPYKILGLGIDYSYSRISASNPNSEFQKEYYRNRVLFNANLITLVQNRTIGYINFQSGIEFLKMNSKGPNSTPGITLEEKSRKVNLRIGYGIQYYLNTNLALLAEAGYGAGVIAKTGVCCWF